MNLDMLLLHSLAHNQDEKMQWGLNVLFHFDIITLKLLGTSFSNIFNDKKFNFFKVLDGFFYVLVFKEINFLLGKLRFKESHDWTKNEIYCELGIRSLKSNVFQPFRGCGPQNDPKNFGEPRLKNTALERMYCK